MDYSPAMSPPASTDSNNGGSEAESTNLRCGQFRCDCGLQPAIRTSLTVQNMGMRFRCCPKKQGPCPYFHFVPTDQRIQGRALELILIIKERESRAIKQKQKLHQQNVDLTGEKEKIADESKRLMKKVEKKCSRANRINAFLVLCIIISTLGFIVTVIKRKINA